MKKEILILVTILTTVSFISCSKEKNELPDLAKQGNEEIPTSPNKGNIDPLTVNLEGWYNFDKNLKDVTGKLPDAAQYPVIRGGVSYTTDRKGHSTSALQMNGSYYVYMWNVPQQSHTSLSVWVKRGGQYTQAEIVRPNGRGPAVYQMNYAFEGDVFTSLYTPYVTSGAYFDQAWHHLVVTYDSTNLKLYVDGVLTGTMNNSQPFVSTSVYYLLGHLTSGGYWKGAIDDLRFYSRTLSQSDVSALFNQ